MDTNVKMVRNLWDNYSPESRGLLTQNERNLITSSLHLEEMDVLQLRNLRDTVVLLSHDFKSENLNEDMKRMDKVSAITSVIDLFIFKQNAEV